MADAFASHAPGLESPALNFAPLTESDSAAIDPRPRYLIATSAGNLVLAGDNNAEVTIPVVAGQHVILRPRLFKTASTATAVGAW